MDPRESTFIIEPVPEEPLGALDYYEAIQGGWLSSDADHEPRKDLTSMESSPE